MVIDLKNGYGAEIAICSNPETVCDGLDVGCWQVEATAAAVEAADKVIFDAYGAFPQHESDFAVWHGGKWYSPDLHYGGRVAANLFRRVIETDDEGEEVGVDWERRSLRTDSELHPIRAALESVLQAADDAMDRVLAEWEEQEQADAESA